MSAATDTPGADAYALVADVPEDAVAPELPYLPPMPRDRSAAIGLIGAGGIAFAHLDAYRSHGLNVVAICDRHLERAEARRDAFFPHARVETNARALIEDPTITVLDITLHPDDRTPLVRQALKAGKHVLSQKPFVRDLAVGAELADLADREGVLLAVNQNGRYAPHLSYMREAVAAGLIGDVIGVHVSIQWNHNWVAGTAFEKLDQLVLNDFAIHWFDFLATIIGPQARTVYAVGTVGRGQAVGTELLAQVLVGFPGGQGSLVFDGSTRYGSRDCTIVVGTKGTLRSSGPDLGHQQVELVTAAGIARPHLQGTWFNDGFAGTMGALLVSRETGTQPMNSARNNLTSLALYDAALRSAGSGQPVAL